MNGNVGIQQQGQQADAATALQRVREHRARCPVCAAATRPAHPTKRR